MAGEGEWTQAQTRPTAWGYSDFLWDPEGLLHICTVTCPESKSRPHFHQELPQVPPRASRLWWQVAFQGQHRREPWVSPGRRPPAIWAGNPGSQFRGVWYRKFSPALSGPQIPHLMGRGTHQTSSRAGLSKVQGLPVSSTQKNAQGPASFIGPLRPPVLVTCLHRDTEKPGQGMPRVCSDSEMPGAIRSAVHAFTL